MPHRPADGTGRLRFHLRLHRTCPGTAARHHARQTRSQHIHFSHISSYPGPSASQYRLPSYQRPYVIIIDTKQLFFYNQFLQKLCSFNHFGRPAASAPFPSALGPMGAGPVFLPRGRAGYVLFCLRKRRCFLPLREVRILTSLEACLTNEDNFSRKSQTHSCQKSYMRLKSRRRSSASLAEF